MFSESCKRLFDYNSLPCNSLGADCEFNADALCEPMLVTSAAKESVLSLADFLQQYPWKCHSFLRPPNSRPHRGVGSAMVYALSSTYELSVRERLTNLCIHELLTKFLLTIFINK